MQLEELVPSLELCQRLKELGFPQDGSQFYWAFEWRQERELMHRSILTNVSYMNDEKLPIAAPLADEILKLIPICIKDPIHDASYHKIENMGWCFSSYYIKLEKPYILNDTRGKTLADTLAKHLIWLIENGHVKFGNEVR